MSNLFEQLAIVKQELAKLEEMMHGNMLQLPWDKAPEWAQWAAMDGDGEWWWYKYDPHCGVRQWNTSLTNGAFEQFSFPPCSNWKESKRKRP